MTVKVLVTELGSHIVAETKQVENKESGEVIAYWVSNPRVASYSRDDNGNINVSFSPYCMISDENEFSIRASNIVSILEPREDVVTRYNDIVNPEVETPTTETEVTEPNEPVADTAEVG